MKRCVRVLVPLLMVLSSGDAFADGGMIRLRETKGPFVVTIFTASDPLQDRPVDVSVMVQKRDSSDAILDATVNLTLAAPTESVAELSKQMCGHTGAMLMSPSSDGQTTQFTVPATHKQASNKLLYAAPVSFRATGNWQLQASIQRGSDTEKLGCTIAVGSPPRRLSGLVPYLALPPLMVLLFAINRSLRERRRRPAWTLIHDFS